MWTTAGMRSRHAARTSQVMVMKCAACALPTRMSNSCSAYSDKKTGANGMKSDRESRAFKESLISRRAGEARIERAPVMDPDCLAGDERVRDRRHDRIGFPNRRQPQFWEGRREGIGLGPVVATQQHRIEHASISPPFLGAPLLQEIIQTAADRQSLVAHRRKDEDRFSGVVFEQAPIQSDVRIDAAADREVAQSRPLLERADRTRHQNFDGLLDRSRRVARRKVAADAGRRFADLAILSKIAHGANAARVLDAIPAHDEFRGDWAAMRREADELALVTVRLESERGGEAAVEQAEAVPLPAPEETLVAAE